MLEERSDRILEGHSDETFAAPKPARLGWTQITTTGSSLSHIGQARVWAYQRYSVPMFTP